MDIALAERTAFLPPMVVGALFFLYRNTLFAAQTHPLTRPFVALLSGVTYLSNTMLSSLTNLMSSANEKALVLRETSLMATNTLFKNIAQVFQSIRFLLVSIVHQISSVILSSVSNIVTKTTELLSSIRFHFTTTIHQTYNFTASLFSTLQDRVQQSPSWFMNIYTFFFPTPKSSYEMIYIGVGITVSLALIALTWYHLGQRKTNEERKGSAKEIEPVNFIEEPVKKVRKSVRRKFTS